MFIYRGAVATVDPFIILRNVFSQRKYAHRDISPPFILPLFCLFVALFVAPVVCVRLVCLSRSTLFYCGTKLAKALRT